MIALAAEPDFLTYLASWLESHARRGSMSSYYYPPLNNIIIHKIIFVHHYTIKIVHSYFDIYTLLDRVTFLEDIKILDTVFL